MKYALLLLVIIATAVMSPIRFGQAVANAARRAREEK